jgi:hypothetical protein
MVNTDTLMIALLVFLMLAAHTLGGCCKWNPNFNKGFSEGFSSIREKKHKSSNFFSAVKFTPKCCERSMFSSSHGCACLSKGKIDFLSSRGGNATIGSGTIGTIGTSGFPEY